MIGKILEINNKWKKKYNKLCVQYETIANDRIKDLEHENDLLNKVIAYRDEIDKLREEIIKYKRKYGKLKGGDDDVKNKNK